MAKETEQRMNIVAINRVDPYVKDIVDSSAHVALYTFDPEANEWEKTDVEGALFVYSRNAEPFYSVFINNRLNTNSLVEPITRFEIQSQPPFLLYRNERSKIRGFWFYNSSECDRIGELINKLVRKSAFKEHKVSNNSHDVNILSMLSKAQEDFNKNTNPAVAGNIHKRNTQPAISINNPSVMNFFGAIPTSLQKLKPAVVPPVHTVDEIEKKQRANTPQNDAAVNIAGNGIKALNIPGSPDLQVSNDLGTSPLVTFLSSVNFGNQPPLSKVAFPIVNAKELSEIEQEQTKPSVANDDILLMKTSNVANEASKPALMPPTMFETSGRPDACEQDKATRLKFNMAPLTKEQLSVTMEYLLKNDSSFVDKLHDAYLLNFYRSSN